MGSDLPKPTLQNFNISSMTLSFVPDSPMANIVAEMSLLISGSCHTSLGITPYLLKLKTPYFDALVD